MAISAIIVAKNEEKKLPDCLSSLEWADEIVVVVNDSTDKTENIARKMGAKIYDYPAGDFSERKNFAASKAKGDWFLFLDADERVTPKLREEILTLIKDQKNQSYTYAIPRKNVIFGKEFRYGGQYPDYMVRLFYKNNFQKWEAKLHEQPKFKGELKYLKNPILHIKHNDLSEMIEKTNDWSEVEAKLMLDAGHPPMNIPRFISALMREFWLRFVRQNSCFDGTKGVIYGIYQIYSRFISYAKLWEMQISDPNNPNDTKTRDKY